MDTRPRQMMGWQLILWAGALAALSGCEKPKAARWMQITQGDPCATAATAVADAVPPAPCEGGLFYLDTANLSIKSGTPYIILQTRYPDGRIGSIRAEVNCPRQMVEPTALKEDIYDKAGALVTNRMTNLSADDERALLKYACSKV